MSPKRSAPRIAFAHRAGIPFRDAGDVIRVIDRDDARTIAIANAYDSGFSTCWPAGSRRLLDGLEEALATMAPREAFARACEALFGAAAELLRDPEFEDDPPAASLALATIRGSTIDVAWIGEDDVRLTRGEEIVARNAPHTLSERFRAQAIEIPAGAKIPNVLTRVARREDAKPDVARWEARAGDVLRMTSAYAPKEGEWREDALGDAAFVARVEVVMG